jgi:hypothetical protein
MIASPAHRAAIAFLRGGLLAIVSLLAAPRAGGLLLRTALPGAVADASALLLPLLGFTAAWAFGGASLGRGRQAVRGFALGGLLTGLLLSLVWPQLAGLTGREPALIVLAFAVAGWGVSFGAGGGLAGRLVHPPAALALARGFAVGGAAGASIFVVPSLASGLGYGDWPPIARLFVSTITSVAGLLAPFAIGGAAAGRLLGDSDL